AFRHACFRDLLVRRHDRRANRDSLATARTLAEARRGIHLPHPVLTDARVWRVDTICPSRFAWRPRRRASSACWSLSLSSLMTLGYRAPQRRARLAWDRPNRKNTYKSFPGVIFRPWNI